MEIPHDDFYRRLRRKVVVWAGSKRNVSVEKAGMALLAPDFFYLLAKLSVDPEVPKGERTKLGIALAYFVSPIDLLPEMFLGPVGYIDDVALAAYVLNGLINKTGPEIVQKHWPGEGDALEAIKRAAELADRMLGSGLWNRLKKLTGGK